MIMGFADFMRAACCALAVIILSVGSVFAQEVKIGIGFALPPYVIKESNSGLEVDIIREALKVAGYDVQFVYLPNLRLPVEFAAGDVDGVAANAAYNLGADSGRVAYASRITATYQNYAITLKDEGIVIKDVKDLGQWNVLAFNNATKYLGPEFVAMAAANSRYSELADQSLQVRMLYSGRVQVVISDKRIFLWWRKKLNQAFFSGSQDLGAALAFHPVFPAAPRRIFFADHAIRDAFNAGLDQIIKSGEYEAILSRYVSNPLSN